MRLIASPAYRAFPELDSFTDEQCEDFARLAAASSLRRGTALLMRIVTAVGLATFVVATLERFTSVPLEVSAVLALALAGFGWLVTGDLVLRVGIRRVMRRGGSCPFCRYVLVGLPVASSHTVICPECGQQASLAGHEHSVVRSADGVERFLPSTEVVFERPAREWGASVRQTWSWGRWAMAATLALMAIVFGTREMRVRREVALAQSDLAALPTVEELMERLRAAWPAPESDGERAFDVLAEFDRCAVAALPGERLIPLSLPLETWSGRAPPAGSAEEEGERARDAVRRAALLPALLQAGAWDLAVRVARAPIVDPGSLGEDDLSGTPAEMGAMVYPIERPFVARPTQSRRLAQLLHFGAHVAVDAGLRGDHERVAEACEVMQAAIRLRRAVRLQLFDGSPHLLPVGADVIAAIRAPGGADRLARLALAAARFRREHPDPDVVDDVMVAQVSRDIATAFSDLAVVRSRWSTGAAKVRSRTLLMEMNPVVGTRVLRMTPDYMAERRQVDAVVRSAMRAGRATDGAVGWIDPVGAPLLAVASTGIRASAEQNRWIALQARAWEAMLAIEGYRWRHGRLPDLLESLVPEFLPPEDAGRSGEVRSTPVTRSIRYRVLPNDPRGIGYELWPAGSGPTSVAADGDDPSAGPASGESPLIPRY